MQFLIIGLDGSDADAHQRRLAAREEHIKLGDVLLEAGNLWYGAAILDDDGKMIGSAYMVDFPSENDLQEWLKREPYVVGEVWKKIEIYKCNTRDPWQFNRPKEFFEQRK